jgi:hypothetical protein
MGKRVVGLREMLHELLFGFRRMGKRVVGFIEMLHELLFGFRVSERGWLV